MAGIVDNREDVDQIVSHHVEHTIGKSGKQGASDTGQKLCVQQWRLLQPSQLQLKRRFKLCAQPLALCLVPLISLTDLPDSAARKLQAVRHDPFFNFALT